MIYGFLSDNVHREGSDYYMCTKVFHDHDLPTEKDHSPLHGILILVKATFFKQAHTHPPRQGNRACRRKLLD